MEEEASQQVCRCDDVQRTHIPEQTEEWVKFKPGSEVLIKHRWAQPAEAEHLLGH